MIRTIFAWVSRMYRTGDHIQEHVQRHEDCGLPALWRFKHVISFGYGLLLMLAIVSPFYGNLRGQGFYPWEAIAYAGLPLLAIGTLLLETMTSLFFRMRIRAHEDGRLRKALEWLQELQEAPETFQRHAEAHGCRLPFSWGWIRHAYPVLYALIVAAALYFGTQIESRRYALMYSAEMETTLSFFVSWFYAYFPIEGIRRANMLKTVSAHEGQSPEPAPST